MQGKSSVISGYLDVKISAKSRRGLTPWKAWQKQWCELRRLDDIENGVEIKLKSGPEGSILNGVILPRSSTICRTESRTKQYAFGVFTNNVSRAQHQRPLLFLSGNSETEVQEWISSIRRMLCVATYLPVGESMFHISVVDNPHSRSSGLTGLHGVLGPISQEITISDPCTAQRKITWPWFHFHQFHFQAPSQSIDENKIIVMHTSAEFSGGPGQIYLYCEQGPRLLAHLAARGKPTDFGPFRRSGKRLSRSEDNLCSGTTSADSPLCVRSQTGSEDSGVRVSISSDDSQCTKAKSGSVASMAKTPGGSETNEDSVPDLTVEEFSQGVLPRRESGISLSSGIYEEISDEPTSVVNHIYENPIELILRCRNKQPPPLPPRLGSTPPKFSLLSLGYKQRCNTLPAKDLSRMSQVFSNSYDPDYMVMSSSADSAKTKDKEKSKISAITESLYVPMSPVINLKNKIESCYMIMNGGRKLSEN